MHVGVTLSPEEFSKLHNALCRIGYMVDILKNADHEKYASDLEVNIEEIRAVLKPAYDADGEMFDKLHAHFHAVGEEFDAKTTWSIYEVHDLNTKHDYPGAKTITHKSHWGEDTPVIPIQGDTWADLYIAADHAICQSGDMHHSFIEGFVQDGDTLYLQTGS